LAVLDVVEGGFLLKERAPGVSVDEIQLATEGRLVVPKFVPEMIF
jgi:3-oxoacid CoA-transferase subunit B